MPGSGDRELDRLALTLVRDMAEDLRRRLPTKSLDRELVSVIYLRVREQVSRSREEDVRGTLALQIYLTVCAWEARTIPLDLLADLHATVDRTLAGAEQPVRKAERGNVVPLAGRKESPR